MPYMRSYLQQGFEVEVLGGGRILHDAQRLAVPNAFVTSLVFA